MLQWLVRDRGVCDNEMTNSGILFLIESLGGGGAEKVLSTLIKYIDRERFDITVCVISGGGIYEKEIAERVRVHRVLKSASSYSGLGKVWYRIKYQMIYHWLPTWLVYQLLIPKGNDVEVAFVEGFATRLLASSTNRQTRKIAWVHCDLQNQPWPISTGVFGSLKEEKCAYEKYDSVVCVSKQVESVMKEYYGLANTMTIYNPIDVYGIRQLASQENEWDVDSSKFNVISVGRLERVKGYDELIPIIGKVRDRCNDIHLWLVGEGTQVASLKGLVKKIGIEDCITFTGFVKNPYSLMSQMDLFVCSSRAEGFSLVIAEAMTLGVPVVSIDCAGPRELISKYGEGVLCDSYDELEQEIIKSYHTKTRQKNRVTSFDGADVILQIEKLIAGE